MFDILDRFGPVWAPDDEGGSNDGGDPNSDQTDGQDAGSGRQGTGGSSGDGGSAAGSTLAGSGTPDGDASGGSGEGDDGEGSSGGGGAAEGGWPENWRQQIAAARAPGDEKGQQRIIKRLERMKSPDVLYGSFSELENTFHSGNSIRVPDENSSDEDKQAFRTALGVPEKPEGYIDNLKLKNDMVLGDDDLPVAQNFAERMHGVGAQPQVVNEVVQWYMDQQEEAAAKLDELDDKYKDSSESELKEEWGPRFKRNVNSIGSLFQKFAPGGADSNNPESVFSELLGGRTASGKLIGDHPGVLRMLVNINHAVNPLPTVMEGTGASLKDAETRIKEIQSLMRTNRAAYNKDTAMQQELMELLEARDIHMETQGS